MAIPSRKRTDVLGQTFTWLSGGALALSILMILGLLGLLTWMGMGYFWPKSLVEITLQDGSRVWGELHDREALSGINQSAGERAKGVKRYRINLKTGNRDVYDLDFRWIDEDRIASTATPEDLVHLERLEWGNFYGRLKELRKDGRKLELDGGELWPRFVALIDEKEADRDAIHDIEKDEVGAISYRLERLRLRALENNLADRSDETAALIAEIDRGLATTPDNREQLARERARIEADLEQKRQSLIRLWTARDSARGTERERLQARIDPIVAARIEGRARLAEHAILEKRAELRELRQRIQPSMTEKEREIERARSVALATQVVQDEANLPLRKRMIPIEEQNEELAELLVHKRKRLLDTTALLVTAEGTQREIAAGNIVRAIRPNAMSTLEKIGLYVTRVWDFIWDEPRESNTEGGIFPAIFGTVLMVFIMTFAVTPFGILAALYLREYAKDGPVVRLVRIAVNNLAGVPSIVFGIFGLGFFVYLIGGSIDQLFYPERLPSPTFGTGGILWGALTLALLTVPVVIVATEEGLAAVPKIVRQGSLALGATKFETIWKVVLPAAGPGILTGIILAIARAAGEVAPLMIVGMVKTADLPIDGHFPFLHLESKFMHLGFHIYDLGFQSPNVEATKPLVYATALLLVLLVTVMNLVAIGIRNHLRKKYATSAV